MGLEGCEQLSAAGEEVQPLILALTLLCDLGQVASPLCGILSFSMGVSILGGLAGGLAGDAIFRAERALNRAWPIKPRTWGIRQTSKMGLLNRLTHEYLSMAPFADYLDSIYFNRFLQWKWLER